MLPNITYVDAAMMLMTRRRVMYIYDSLRLSYFVVFLIAAYGILAYFHYREES